MLLCFSRRLQLHCAQFYIKRTLSKPFRFSSTLSTKDDYVGAFTLLESKPKRKCYVNKHGEIEGFDGDLIFDEDKKLVDSSGVEVELFDWHNQLIDLSQTENLHEEYEEDNGDETHGEYRPETKSVKQLLYVLKSLGVTEDLSGMMKDDLISLFNQTMQARRHESAATSSKSYSHFKAEDLSVIELKSMLKRMGVNRLSGKTKKELVAILDALPAVKEFIPEEMSNDELRYVLRSDGTVWEKGRLESLTREQLLELVRQSEMLNTEDTKM